MMAYIVQARVSVFALCRSPLSELDESRGPSAMRLEGQSTRLLEDQNLPRLLDDFDLISRM